MIGDSQDWCDVLKAGDRVAVKSTGAMRGKEISVVDRVTATQIILKNGRRYAKRDGYRVGTRGHWSRSYICPCTQEIEAEVFDRETRAKIMRVDWNTVPLTNILEILDKIP